jgi:hypothetical protein
MGVSVLSPTKFAAALVAGGVVSAVSFVGVPEPRALPMISADVANASVITDALYGFGDGVGVLSSLVGIHVDATISLPFEATLAALAAAQHPAVAPNVLSYLVQRFVNPIVGPPIAAYPWETENTFAVIASLLPYPLGPSATEPGLVNEARVAFADVFNSVLGQLPDPMPGFNAVQGVMNDTVLGGTVVAGQFAVRAPLYMAWNIVNYLGYLPANVEATVESAIQDPGHIAGLASNLVYGLLSPDAKVGLFGQLLDNVVDPFTWLPAPIGQSANPNVGLANEIRKVIDDATNEILSVLPEPVQPSAAQAPPAILPTGTSTAYGDDAATALRNPVEKGSVSTTLTATDTAPDTARPRKAESVKDRVARTSTRSAKVKPARTGSAKPAHQAASGGRTNSSGKSA